MRAAVINEFGQAPKPGPWDKPGARPGYTLFRVEAAAVNPVDIAIGEGRFYAGSPQPPFVAGSEAAGRVVHSEKFAAGTLVWGIRAHDADPSGMWAEFAELPDERIVAVDERSSAISATAHGIGSVTAWTILAWYMPVRRADRVLVLGATGAVGFVALQVARLRGAARIVAAGRDERALKRALSVGADEAVPVHGADFARRLVAAFGSDGPTYIFDPLWGEPAVQALDVASPAARLVQLGQSADNRATIASSLIRGKQLQITGFSLESIPLARRADSHRRVLAHARAGRLTLPTEAIPLEDVEEAWQRQLSGAQAKLVLVP